MTSTSALRKLSAAFLLGAFALSACGGGTPTAAPTSGTPTSAASTPAVTPPPATDAPATDAPATEAPATSAPGADPADDLAIAAPYTFQPLDENIAALFETQMQQSLGSMAGVFEIGFRSAVRDGQTEAWVIVMRFPDLPITAKALLDQIAQGASQGGGSVESTTLGGEPARIISAQGQALVVSLAGNSVVMTVGTAKKATINVATAIAEAN